MKAHFDPSHKSHHVSHDSTNVPQLKRDLKEKTHHLQKLFQTALNNPDQINQSFLQDLSSSVLDLHDLCNQAQSLPQSNVDLVRSLKESSDLLNNIIQAPIYV